MHLTPEPTATEPPRLRLVQAASNTPLPARASLGAWITLFGALSFCGGHGIFLFTALTRLSKLPGARELGGPLEIAVLAWFVVAGPLALASVALRARFLRLSARRAWSLAALALALGVTAGGFYLRAIALA